MNEMSPADYAAINGNNGGFFGGDGGWFWIVILFLFCFAGGWGGMGGGAGAQPNYVLTSDFAQVERKLDSITNGICDLGYTNQSLNNATNVAMLNGFNQIGTQMAQCCCDNREAIAGVNYNMATQANMLSRDVERGFCDTQYRDAMNTNALMQSGHSDADRILAKLDAMEGARKDERIAEQNQTIFNLQLKASQEAQNNYLTNAIIGQLKTPCPIPAYTVPNPNCCYNNGGCNGF